MTIEQFVSGQSSKERDVDVVSKKGVTLKLGNCG